MHEVENPVTDRAEKSGSWLMIFGIFGSLATILVLPALLYLLSSTDHVVKDGVHIIRSTVSSQGPRAYLAFIAGLIATWLLLWPVFSYCRPLAERHRLQVCLSVAGGAVAVAVTLFGYHERYEFSQRKLAYQAELLGWRWDDIDVPLSQVSALEYVLAVTRGTEHTSYKYLLNAHRQGGQTATFDMSLEMRDPVLQAARDVAERKRIPFTTRETGRN